LPYVALKLSGFLSGFPENQEIGSGMVLDRARLKYLLGEYLGVERKRIERSNRRVIHGRNI